MSLAGDDLVQQRISPLLESGDPGVVFEAAQPLVEQVFKGHELLPNVTADAIELLRHALALAPKRHELRPDVLASLGRVLQARYAHSGSVEHIQNAALSFQDAAELLYPMDRIEALEPGEITIDDMDDTINALPDPNHDDTTASPASNLERAHRHGRIGTAFWLRYIRTPTTSHTDLVSAVHHLRLASELSLGDPTARVDRLNGLSRAHNALFTQLGTAEDATQAIICASLASDAAPMGTPRKAQALFLLGSALMSRALRTEPSSPERKTMDLEDATRELGTCVAMLLDDRDMTVARHRVADMSDDDSEKPAYLVHIAWSLLDRYEQLECADDLESAIGHLKSAVDLRTHSPVPWCEEEFDRTINAVERALSLASASESASSSSMSVSTNHLAEWLGLAILIQLEKYGPEPSAHQRTEVLDGAERAERYLQHAIDNSASQTEPEKLYKTHRGILYTNLGIAILLQFRLLGHISDFERAVSKFEDARSLLDADKESQPHLWARPISQLGAAYREAFAHFGEPTDLVHAAASFQSVVDAVQDKPGLADIEAEALDNFADVLLIRFRHMYAVADADRAIRVCQRAVEITPAGDYNDILRATRLNRLAVALQLRFEHLGIGEPEELVHLEGYLERAIALVPQDSPSRVKYLGNLASFRRVRYQSSSPTVGGQLSDLDRAIVVLREAIELAPKGNSKIYLRWQLGEVHRLRYARLRELADLDEAAFAFNVGACDPFAHAQLRLKLALAWANLWLDATSAHPEILTLNLLPDMAHAAETQTIGLLTHIISKLPKFASHNLSVGRRRDEIARAGLDRRALSAAAAVAFIFRQPKHALEWIEEGRGVMWRQLMNLRAPMDDLKERDPAKAEELRRVARALEVGIENVADTENGATSGGSILSDRASRALAHQREQLLWDVQDVDGLEDPSLCETHGNLLHAAQDGPVAIVNVVDRRCDGLVLLPGGEMVHVPLPGLSLSLAKNLRARFNEYLYNSGVRGREVHTRAIRRNVGTDSSSIVKKVLSQLWLNVVEPILTVLKEKGIVSTTPNHGNAGQLPHVTWCPTGPLTSLPLHAAGLYDSVGGSTSARVYNFVVSSYTPSLSSLLHARRPRDHARVGVSNLKMLVLSQPETPGHSPLPGTIAESEIIAKHFGQMNGSQLALERLVGEEASTSTVLRAMSQCNWVHLACHGIQDISEPTNSAFAMHDGRLTLATLMRESLPDVADFAFLSACQTATGDVELEDEMVHLAAGMLSVGYRSVIGTMWAIGDSDAPVVADAFYELIKKDLQGKRSKAYALHAAIARLRDEAGEDKFVRWIPFVHYGV